jgi:hypothetical protein
VEASETKFAPKAKQSVLGKLQLPKRRSNPQLVCVKSAHLPIEGTLVAHGLAKVLLKVREPPKQQQAVTLSTDSRQQNSSVSPVYVYVMATNLSHEHIVLPKATVLGVAEEIVEYFYDQDGVIYKEEATGNIGYWSLRVWYKTL